MGSYLTPGIFSGLGQGLESATRLFTALSEAQRQREAEERRWQQELLLRKQQLESTEAQAIADRKAQEMREGNMLTDSREDRATRAALSATELQARQKEAQRERMAQRAAQEQANMRQFRIMGPQPSGAPYLPGTSPMEQAATRMAQPSFNAERPTEVAPGYTYLPEPPSRSVNTSILAGDRGGAGSLGARIQTAFANQVRIHVGAGFSATGVSGPAQREIYRNVLQTFVTTGELSPQQAERALAEFHPQNITTLMQQFGAVSPGSESDTPINSPAPAAPPAGSRPGGPTRTRFQ